MTAKYESASDMLDGLYGPSPPLDPDRNNGALAVVLMWIAFAIFFWGYQP